MSWNKIGKNVRKTTEREGMDIPSRPVKESEHAFSVEIDVVKLNEAGDRLLIEGFLGELDEMGFVEDVMLEIKGVEGILRIELKEEELRKLLQKGSHRSHVQREKALSTYLS